MCLFLLDHVICKICHVCCYMMLYQVPHHLQSQAPLNGSRSASVEKHPTAGDVLSFCRFPRLKVRFPRSVSFPSRPPV